MKSYLKDFSEDAMDVDSGVVPTSKEDDLSKYNLDDYDNDVHTTSEFMVLISYFVIITLCLFF